MPPCSDRQQPAGEHEERRIVENGEDGLLKQARHLGLDVGDNARRPRSSLQQRVERRAAVSGLQVQTGSCGHVDIRTYLGVVRKAPRAAPRRRGLQMPVKMGCLLPQGG